MAKKVIGYIGRNGNIVPGDPVVKAAVDFHNNVVNNKTQNSMKRLVMLSYDATKEFKEAYEKKNNKQFEPKDLWKALYAMKGDGVEIKRKPVESTLLLETKTADQYRMIAATIRAQFEKLPFAIETIARIGLENLYEEYPNPVSQKEIKDFLDEMKAKEEAEKKANEGRVRMF